METPAIAEGSLLEPAATTTQTEKDLINLDKSQVKAYFGRKPDKTSGSNTWIYEGTFYDPDAEVSMTECWVNFQSGACLNVSFFE